MGKKGKGKGKGRQRAGREEATAAAFEGSVGGPGRRMGSTPEGHIPEPGSPDLAGLAERLAGLAVLLERLVDRSGSQAGLSESRRSALVRLVLGGPRTIGSLAAAECVRPPTMTRLVHALEADGLVERGPNAADGRSVVLRATPAGERLLEGTRASRLAPLVTRLERLDEPDRRALARALGFLEPSLRDG